MSNKIQHKWNKNIKNLQKTGIFNNFILNFEGFYYSLFNFGLKLALQIIKFIFRNFYGFFDTPEGASIVWKNKNLSQPASVVYI